MSAYIFVAAGMRRIVAVPWVAAKSFAIDPMRAKLLADKWLDRDFCKEGIKCIDAYQFVWAEHLLRYSNEPLGDWVSHGADAWMQYAQGYDLQVGVLDEHDESWIAPRFNNYNRTAR